MKDRSNQIGHDGSATVELQCSLYSSRTMAPLQMQSRRYRVSYHYHIGEAKNVLEEEAIAGSRQLGACEIKASDPVSSRSDS